MSNIVITIPAGRAGKTIAMEEFIQSAQKFGLSVRYADPRRKGPVQIKRLLTPQLVRRRVRDAIKRALYDRSHLPGHVVTDPIGTLSPRSCVYIAAKILSQLAVSRGYRCGINQLPEELCKAALETARRPLTPNDKNP